MKQIINLLIALVWVINGLICKLVNLVPRHQEIVTRILGREHAPVLTKLIGILEILMAIWILSTIKRRLCVHTQVLLVATMNIIECIVAPDLLLFGYGNLFFAGLFIAVVYLNEFGFRKRNQTANK